MPSIDEILAAAEEPEEESEEKQEAPNPEGNRAFKQLRDHAKSLETRSRKQEKELEELRSFKAQVTQTQVAEKAKSLFKEAGLNEKQAALFLRTSDGEDPTPEAVQAFAAEYGLILGEDGEEVPAPAGESTGFPPQSTSTVGVERGHRVITRDELEKMAKTNPSRAQEYLRQGRVKWNNIPS